MAKKPIASDDWLNGGPIEDDDEQGPGATVDKRQFCRIFGITPYAANAMIDRGMPVKVRGDKHTPWEIEVGRAMEWMAHDAIARLDDDSEVGRYREAKTRKMQAEWERLKRENDATRRELVTPTEGAAVVRENSDIVRKHLYAMPGAVTKALAALPLNDRRDASIVERVIDDCMNDALRAISEDCSEGVEHVAA